MADRKPNSAPQPSLPSDDRVGRYVSDLLQSVASRDRLKELLKSLALVVPLTLLIWVYAERAQSTDDKVTVSVELAIADPGKAALLTRASADDATATRVSLTLEGPRSRIDFVKTEIIRRSIDGRLKMNLPGTLGTGREHELSVVDIAKANDPFLDSGVTIKSAEPGTITVRVDAIESRDVPVQLPREVASIVTQQRFEPATVRVRGPASVIARVFAQDGFNAQVDLSAVKDWKLPGVSKQFDNVPLLPPGVAGLSFSPTTVKVILDVNPLEPRYSIPSVPISIQKPVNMDGNYRVEIIGPPALYNVRVIGPQDKIELIKNNRATPRPTAVLVVTSDDLGKDGHRVVRYDLPQDVRLDEAPKEVDFRIIEQPKGP